MLIRRKEIKKNEIKEEIVNLSYTKHAMDRINERFNGTLLLYPRILKKCANNISFIDTKQMSWGYSVKVKTNLFMILVLNNTNVVKTIYFKEKKNGYTSNNK